MNAEPMWTDTEDRPCDLLEMLEPDLVAGRIDRKWRLYLCACARQLDTLLSPLDRAALDLAERFADGQASNELLTWERYHSLERSTNQLGSNVVTKCLYRNGTPSLQDAVGYRADEADLASPERVVDRQLQTAILNDIFGSWLCPLTIESHWLTSTVLDLSNSIYAERQFERMPILGDALMDAGCDNEALLNHCVSKGPHFRGCWVVDLLLGKPAGSCSFATAARQLDQRFRRSDHAFFKQREFQSLRIRF